MQSIVRSDREGVTVGHFGNEGRANLIAAAPELLEMVKRLLDNAELDALNEPELRGLCREASDLVARAEGI